MKLVELLANEMNKWPEDCTCGYCVQACESTEVFFGGPARSIFLSELADDRETAKVTTAQWQAERDRQKGGEWKRHRGGKQPVADEVIVEVKLRDGDIQQHCAKGFAWPFTDCDVDANILKYRVISQPQAEEVEVIAGKKWYEPAEAPDTREYKGPFLCAPAGEPVTELEWDIQFQQGIFHIESKTDQIDGPIKWRDTVNELNAYIEKFTRERDELINRLAEEGFALIPAMTAVVGVADYSGPHIESYRDWRAGDLVTGKVDYNGQFTKGRQYKLADVHVDTGRIDVEVDDKGEENGWTAHNFEFHSRP